MQRRWGCGIVAAIMAGCGGTSKKLAVFLALLIAVVAMGSVDNRAVADVGDDAKAEELIRQANELRRRGDNAPAFRLYLQAYQLSRNPRTAAQLALCELSLGYWMAAHDHLTEALTSVSHHPWIDANRATLEEQRKEAAAHLANLIVDGAPSGAEVLVNGKLVGRLPMTAAVKVSEGRIDIEVRSSTHRPMTRTLTLVGGASERLSVELVPIDVGKGPEPAPAGERTADLPGWRRVLPWSLLAAGVLAGAVGAWQHVRWRDTQASFEAIDGCGADDPGRGSDLRCEGLYGDLRSSRTRAFFGYGAAGVLGAGAAALFVLNASAQPEASASIAVGSQSLTFFYRTSF